MNLLSEDIQVGKIWDWISVSIVGILAYPAIQFIVDYDLIYLWCGVGLLLTHVLTVGIKQITTQLSDHPVFKRPPKATDCDIFCRNGDVSGKPGFPSGHVAHATFFACFITFMYPKNHVLQSILVLYVLLVGLARYKKYCHNIEQILAGTLLGFATGSVWHFVYSIL